MNRNLREIILYSSLLATVGGVCYFKLPDFSDKEKAIERIKTTQIFEIVSVQYNEGLDNFFFREDFPYRGSEARSTFRERVRELNPKIDTYNLHDKIKIRIPNLDELYQEPELNKNKN